MENKNTFTTQNATATSTVAPGHQIQITRRTKLREVLDMLGLKPGQRRKGKTPTRVNLIATGGEPIAHMGGSTLYANGYAIYENGYGRYSVVWLPYCVNYTYNFNKLRDAEKDYLKEKAELPEGLLLSTKWTVAVALCGEERITQHLERGIGNADISEEEEEEDDTGNEEEDEDDEGKYFTWDDNTLGVDPLDAVIRRETREAMLSEMTDKQREVFVLHYKYGWKQKVIAENFGISPAAVCQRLNDAKKAAREFFKKF
ncbi:MAG: sigma-70 family RNA polymerase sigma factor [Oscillospiraceae bacterium]|nr:sigma-70 family RNA polymerase sigma factor [Oscillospiraceae bacterium]